MICRNHAEVSEGARCCSRCKATFCRDCLVDIGGSPYCAPCKTEQLLDVRSGVTPPIDLASIGRRFVAIFLDTLIIVIPMGIFDSAISGATLTVGWHTYSYTSPLYWITTAISVIYQASMLQAHGQTLGKKALNVKVVRLDGSDISKEQAWVREVSRPVLALLCFVDYLPTFVTKGRRSIHDMLARTVVVNWNPDSLRFRSLTATTDSPSPSSPPPHPLR
jgi:uncharacterized RDD family membrane protein YckC